MSDKHARELYKEARQLHTVLLESRWSDARQSILDDDKSPLDLFNNEERPLVVGLFGGTGAGKSSLLNRMAGADIARTGVVRPTSMEITAYLHRNVRLDALPEHFSTDRFSDNRHENDQLAEVMWVDMPDFDSAEVENRTQVVQWLPHIDVMIYVVTPERYKDAEGWRMMLEHGYRHAWLFVLNQWDRADPLQYNDFVNLLEKTGFTSPQVFRTVAVGEHEEDQFDALVKLISSLAERNIAQVLQERGWVQRLSAVESWLQQTAAKLTGHNNLLSSFNDHWREFEQSAATHLDGPFKTHAALFAEDKLDAVSRFFKSRTGTDASNQVSVNIAARANVAGLLDDGFAARLDDTLQQFMLDEEKHGVPRAVLADQLELSGAAARNQSVRHLEKAVARAVNEPGTQWQRTASSVAHWLKILLPVAAIAWVVWRVLAGFIAGAENREAYVGLDFLINGAMLAGFGWAIPLVAEKFISPSVPDSVYRSLHQGLQSALDDMALQIQPSLKEVEQKRSELHASCTELQHKLEVFGQSSLPDAEIEGLLLNAPDSLIKSV